MSQCPFFHLDLGCVTVRFLIVATQKTEELNGCVMRSVWTALQQEERSVLNLKND